MREHRSPLETVLWNGEAAAVPAARIAVNRKSGLNGWGSRHTKETSTGGVPGLPPDDPAFCRTLGTNALALVFLEWPGHWRLSPAQSWFTGPGGPQPPPGPLSRHTRGAAPSC